MRNAAPNSGTEHTSTMFSIFSTLQKKLSLILFAVLTIVGSLVFYLVLYATDMYQQELSQKLNATLAQHIVSEDLLNKEGDINQEAMKQIIHMLMVINPSIEVYVLDATGQLLAFSAPQGKVKLKQVDLKPIKAFIKSQFRYPFFGQDPRNPEQNKIFSAAQIPPSGEPEGYVYVILASEAYESVAHMIKDSYILRYSFGALLFSLVLALISGLVLLTPITRRLTRLSRIMTAFSDNTHSRGNNPPNRYLTTGKQDEIETLGKSFNAMAERIEAQMSQLKQNDAKRRELIANVSHDLRTPLTSLHGYLETLLLKQDQLPEQQRMEYLRIATAHSERLNQLIAELFELAKLDSVETLLNVEPFSLAELIQDVVYKYKLAADERGIELRTLFGGELPFVYGDIALIQRVLENLIDNAMRYTPKHGKITVALTPAQENISVTISDTGCGIPAEELPHIFDRFYRIQKNRENDAQATKNNSSNTGNNYNSGLGLAITKRILALHNSQIKAASTLEKGTSFSFKLAACSAN
ncbi:MAG: HAMP domain-containing histidine kinase [Gammaproteobacteria bacterium]|nr:HAMP domain-containing histidine kinase [Gammaproteobacteria bacterium]MDH5801807.1 HAMP domain-containing histidine kinase [Gammaproteobacteria bacterium]